MRYNSQRWYDDYRMFTHTYEHNGEEKTRRYVVRRDGTIESENTGRPMTKHMRTTTLKSGAKRTQVQVRLPHKLYNYSRVVAAAWYPFFDINDLQQVVKHRNGNQFDFRPINLYVTERNTRTKYLTEIQQQAIKWIRENETGRFGRKPSLRAIAKLYDVSKDTIASVLNGTY